MSTSLGATQSEVSVKRYMRWLEIAVSMQSGTSEGKLVSLLREAGAPEADAEAIAAGISNLREASSRADRARRFIANARLDNHGGSYQAELSKGRKTRRNIRRWMFIVLSGICSTFVAIAMYSVRRHELSSDVGMATSAQTQTVAKQGATASELSERHSSSHFHGTDARKEVGHLGNNVKRRENGRKRASSLSSGSDISATIDVVQPSWPRPASHPESCPLGVDRLGCPGAATSLPSAARLTVPVHAHYEATGFGWECNAGYVQKDDACSPMHVPPRAHLDVSGHGWFCDDGFVSNGETCVPSTTQKGFTFNGRIRGREKSQESSPFSTQD
ncbi:hypothetical protein [Paraburkholderia youngii]|uniref:hypothetical protein n=1 Tax=Paraburkholderia youngii TaxID=2782701 RepID=UPI003D236823